jgi:CHAT domain-containing protein/Flp pilus assembly protein TadD
MVETRAREDLPAGGASFSIFCGRWEEPSAQILKVPSAESPMTLAAGGWWREGIEAIASCEPPRPETLLDGIEAAVMGCTMRRGGWPYAALVARLDGDVYLSDGIPAALEAVERGIGLESGRLKAGQVATDEAGTSQIARLEARIAGANYSAGDLQRYRDLLRLAQLLNYEGNFGEAERRYREALSLQQKILRKDSGGLAFVLMHLALELSNQERFDEADRLFRQAETLVPASLDPTDEARLTSYRALHAANQRRFDSALELARLASETRIEVAQQFGLAGPGGSSASTQFAEFTTGGSGTSGPLALAGPGDTALGDLVQSKYLEAAMLLQRGQLADADRAAAEALDVLRREPRLPRRWLPQVLILQGEVAERGGDLRTAEQRLRAAVAEQQTIASGSRTEGQALIVLGRVLAAQGRRADALDAYRQGFAHIRDAGGGIRVGAILPYARAGIAEAGRSPGAGARLNAEMFEVGQLVQGTLTAQTVALAAARLASSEENVGSLVRELQDARRQREALNETLTQAQANPEYLPPQLARLEQDWQAINASIGQLERQVQAAAPRYNQLVDSPISFEKVQEALKDDEALVQILIGPGGSVGFFVDRTGAQVYEIGLSEPQVARIVSRLRQPFDNPKARPDRFDTETAHQLFRQLFQPVADRLARARHVVVVPSGPLFSLPFAVLVVEPGTPSADGDYSRVAWMGRRHGLTVAPSVQSFVNLRTTVRPTLATERFIGFGDFVPIGDADGLVTRLGLPDACRAEAESVANAVPLPNTARELRAIASALGASERSLVLGTDFSEPRIREMRLADYGIVYFATHGLLPHQLECWSEPLLLVSSPAAGGDGDGLLTASEIVELDLDADLVVLSACNTGGPGDETGGESLSGLARAFFYAGARSLLVTHWEIPDQPTVDLMIGAFRNVSGADLTVAEALRLSQEQLMNDPRLSHPFFWGAFTLVGDGARRLNVATAARS